MEEHEIVVGRGFDEAVAEVASAWKAALEGSPMAPTSRIYIRDWLTLCAVLSPDRYILLRRLRQSPARNVTILAEALGRRVPDVEADIVALSEIGLVDRAADGRLSSEVDEITSTIRIAA